MAKSPNYIQSHIVSFFVFLFLSKTIFSLGNQTEPLKWVSDKKEKCSVDLLLAFKECTQANSVQRVHQNNALHVGNMHMFSTWIKCFRPQSAGGHVWWNSAEPQVSLHPFILLWNNPAQRETTGQEGGWQWWDVAQNSADADMTSKCLYINSDNNIWMQALDICPSLSLTVSYLHTFNYLWRM